VLLAEGTDLEWFEIDESKTFSSSTVRSDVTAYQDVDPGAPVQLLPLASELTIEEGGSYVLRATFDVTDTFEYADLDADGKFEPLSDDHDGTMNGIDCALRKPVLSLAVE
jgi:hypothetical protein